MHVPRSLIYHVALVIACFFMLSSCKTLHIGGGVSYDNGTSGGCVEKSGTSGGILVNYYFGKQEGPGIIIGAHPLGYTDCNDGDPLIHMTPGVSYKMNLKPNLAFIPKVTYVFGPYVDEGGLIGLGLRSYYRNHIFMDLSLDYYTAFKEKMNAVRPGKSDNVGMMFSIGYAF